MRMNESNFKQTYENERSLYNLEPPKTGRKYQITDCQRVLLGGIVVKKIQALKDFADVKAGDFGGFVESDGNLSHQGNCWIYSGAVYEHAFIGGNATVKDPAAEIFGNAEIIHEACVRGRATIKDFVEISGDAQIIGQNYIQENARITGQAIIKDYAKIEGSALITDQAVVGEHATIKDQACICGNAQILGKQIIRNNMMIGGDIWKKVGPIYIDGSVYDICTFSKNMIQIGNQRQSVKTWIENKDEAMEMLTENANIVTEYTYYINMIAQMVNNGYFNEENL